MGQNNINANVNPFAFNHSASSTFVPATQIPSMNETRQFYQSSETTEEENNSMAFIQNG